MHWKVYQTVLDSGRGYTHYYDRGIWFNLKEIFWPRCFEPDSTYPHVKKIIPPTVKMGTRKNAAGSKNKETLATGQCIIKIACAFCHLALKSQPFNNQDVKIAMFVFVVFVHMGI